jgi:cell division protein FtsL
MRFVHLIVVAALVSAAAYVYKIKFEATLQAEQVAKLRAEIRRERDAVAALRAQWAQLDNPERIQGLAQRHLALRPVQPTQFDQIDRLPERPPNAPAPNSDPIGALIENVDTDRSNGSVPVSSVTPKQLVR